jgi:hypothetical protein
MKKYSAHIEDLAGRKFGMLTVLKRAGTTKDNHILWECLCECGNHKNVGSNTLKHELTKSCGCLRSIIAKRRIKADGVWNEGKSYAIHSGTKCYHTKHGWAKAVIRHYGNKCEICGWDKARCDTHHRTHKSKGGLHTIENGQVLCPNCHRVVHLGLSEKTI